MKKCEYCGKEISYFEQYCDDDCHYQANKFYEMNEKYGKLFALINGVCVFGIPIGIFIFSFSGTIGITVAVASCFILGILMILLPFPTDGMISKHKIKEAVKRTRIFGLVIIGFGVVLGLFFVYFTMFNPTLSFIKF